MRDKLGKNIKNIKNIKNTKNIKKVKDATVIRGHAAAADNSGETAEKAVTLGKVRLETVVNGYGELAKVNKLTLEALVEASNATVQGVEALNAELLNFGKIQLDETVEAVKAVLNVKSPHELVDIQTNYARGAFDAYVAQGSKMSEMTTRFTRQAFAPITAQIRTAVEKLVKPITA
jgi:phasin family protein